jgi:hypothetical protein
LVSSRATRQIRRLARVLIGLLGVAHAASSAEAPRERVKYMVADGWHPWYEIKADPESPQNLIICGTRWDSDRNAPSGFVYASADGGANWKTALEDKATAWVSEHSCAFGPDHKAYFVSAASKVVDGTPRHELGTTRVFVSNDGGRNWQNTISTGWADYSTSAVSSAKGKLYTFFNSWNTADAGKGWGSSVGLLVFSANGRRVSGPFVDFRMRTLHYRGVFPSNAIALRDGGVIASYYAVGRTSQGWATDIGIVRAGPSLVPSVKSAIVSRRMSKPDRNCDNASDSSLAYDSARSRLFLLYFDRCDGKREIMLTQSSDEGRTWSIATPVSLPPSVHGDPYAPSLLVCPGSILGLLWKEGEDRASARWLFSYIRGHELGPPLELGQDWAIDGISNDSLWSSVAEGEHAGSHDAGNQLGPSIVLNVSSQPSAVWRSHGLVAVGGNVLAAWPEVDANGVHLCLEDLRNPGSESRAGVSTDAEKSRRIDVTRNTLILYSGNQRFDRSSGTLETCLSLKNRGPDDVRTPIELRAEDVSSVLGSVSVLNATNELQGIGAIWDISTSVTGDRIPPGATSNPFCLCFHLNVGSNGNPARPDTATDLLTLRLIVLAQRHLPEHRDTQFY